jgi:hypothetical protein
MRYVRYEITNKRTFDSLFHLKQIYVLIIKFGFLVPSLRHNCNIGPNLHLLPKNGDFWANKL